jgi:serine beta-lactamase-like protein LACTB, mitochondrial
MAKFLFRGLVLAGLLMTSVCLYAQERPRLSQEQVIKIDALIQTQMSESKIPGLSVAIVKEDQLRYSKGFGLADLENSVAAKSTTVYRLGSLSKTITATAVMQLMERGKLDLDAPVQKYCAAFPAKPWPVTARQLLAHMAGVRDYDNQKFLEEYFSTRHYNSITESLDIFRNDPLLQEPGTKYKYSTYGYNVLGCVIEGASAMSYGDYIRESILKPAGMNETGIDDLTRIIANRAHGYSRTQKGELLNTRLADTSNKIAAGGLISSVEDISRFAIALQTGKLLGSAAVEQMWTLQKTNDGQAIPYALGWRIAERNGMKEVFHGGAAAGFSTFLYLLPAKKVAVVLMANMELLSQKERDDLTRRIADLIVG